MEICQAAPLYLDNPLLLKLDLPTMGYIQIGVIGAMQRCQPALTDLFLRWVGVAGLPSISFGIMKADEAGTELITRVGIPPSEGAVQCRDQMADFIGLDPGAEARGRFTWTFDKGSDIHARFWASCRERESQVRSPIEFWWALHLLRSRNIRIASQRFLCNLFGEKNPIFDVAVVGFENPSIEWSGRSSRAMLVNGRYRQPVAIKIATPRGRNGDQDGLMGQIDLPLRGRIISSLMQLATTQTE